ncbi:MAG: YncE family protein, partial [Shewanella sp.]
MKTTTIAMFVGLLFSQSALANTSEQAFFKDTYQSHYDLMDARLQSLRSLAANETNVTIKDGKRYLAVNGVEYQLTSDNNLIFDLPKPTFLDETNIRNVFDFFNDDWELTWYDGGVVAVNKLFGNYDYGNGCQMEYFPHGSLQQGERTNLVMDTRTCQVNAFDTTLKNLDLGYQINAAELGLDPAQISAIERDGNRLYVSQNSNPGYVAIIDIPSQQVIGEIRGLDTATGFAGYNQISELYINDQQLYVVSRYSHRVDIFDLANNHQYLTTLGTGRDNGSNSLHRTQAVVANQDYVLVADANSTIKAYRQQDVCPENSLKTPIAGLLQFEGKYSHRLVQLHLLQDYLVAHTAGKNYYIYDLRKLENAISSGIPLAAEKVIAHSSLQKMDRDGDQLVVNVANRIEWHQVADVIANDFLFRQPQFTVNNINQQPVSALNDLHLLDNTLISANSSGFGVNSLLTKEISFVADNQLDITPIHFDQLMPTAVSYIFDKDEPYEVLADRTLRSVNMNSLVKTELLDNNTVQITNYAAKELRDINIEAKLSGINKWLILGQFDRLPAYAQITLPLSAFGEQGRFNSANRDGIFDLSELLNSNINLPGQFSYRFSSNSDPFAQKLARLKPSWNIRFASNSTGQWRPINALYAKEWLIMATNLAYMVSTEEFKHVWFNFKDLMGYEMFGNGGNDYVSNGIFTAADYQHYYDSLMKRPYLNLGITAMGGGLGGGGITGVDTFNFVSHYYGSWGIIAHEFGHGFDGATSYGHQSAFANGGYGWHPLITVLANYQIRKSDLPYL